MYASSYSGNTLLYCWCCGCRWRVYLQNGTVASSFWLRLLQGCNRCPTSGWIRCLNAGVLCCSNWVKILKFKILHHFVMAVWYWMVCLHKNNRESIWNRNKQTLVLILKWLSSKNQVQNKTFWRHLFAPVTLTFQHEPVTFTFIFELDIPQMDLHATSELSHFSGLNWQTYGRGSISSFH